VNIKTISVVYGRKFNLGDYQSMTIEATAWCDLDEGDDEKTAYDALFAEVKQVVKEQALPVIKSQPAVDVTETFAGKPLAKVASNGH
jgi:hypothetical protein